MELEAANSKGNFRQLFQIVKSMTRKFHPRLQGIQSATGENLTEAAQIAKGIVKTCTVMRKGKELTRVLGARASTLSFRGCSCHPSDSMLQSHSRTVQSRRRDGTGQNAQNMCRSVKLVSGQRNGRSPHSSRFPGKAILNSANYRTIALVSHASKIFLQIILEMIQVKTEMEIADEQAGF